MMTCSVGSSYSYRVRVTSECTHAQWGSFYKQLYTHTHKLSALCSEFWLLFCARAKGIKFYDVPVAYVKEKLRFTVSSTRGMPTAFV